MLIWLNDALVDAASAGVALDGWPDGEGIFETIKTQDGEIFELGRHMRRAVDAAAQKEIVLPSENLVRKAIESLLMAEPILLVDCDCCFREIVLLRFTSFMKKL